MAHDPEALLLAEEDSLIVGSVIAAWDGWRGTIYRLAVAPSHRRGGLGRSLLRAAEERLRDLSAARLQAIVVETDGDGILAGERLGRADRATAVHKGVTDDLIPG